jgi:hypothetical protein
MDIGISLCDQYNIIEDNIYELWFGTERNLILQTRYIIWVKSIHCVVASSHGAQLLIEGSRLGLILAVGIVCYVDLDTIP